MKAHGSQTGSTLRDPGVHTQITARAQTARRRPSSPKILCIMLLFGLLTWSCMRGSRLTSRVMLHTLMERRTSERSEAPWSQQCVRGTKCLISSLHWVGRVLPHPHPFQGIGLETDVLQSFFVAHLIRASFVLRRPALPPAVFLYFIPFNVLFRAFS